MTQPGDAKKDAEGRRPDFQNIDPAMAGKADFPADTSGEFRVHFHPRAHETMMRHAETTSEVELCGVLVGDICRDSQGFFLDIIGAIEGEGANNYGSQVTFTHETWSHIHETKDDRYPDKRIVGWYHTHPGFGVFLSNMDMFIQENFFCEPYQVAVVVETKQNAEGCFYWSKGKCVAARRYWVGDREISLATGDAEPFDPDAESEAGSAGEHRLARPHAAEASPMSSSMLMLMAVMLFAGGLIAGRMLLASSFHQMIYEVAESEVASAIEGVTRSQLAAKDFEQVRDAIRILREDLARDEATPVAARFAALDQRLEALQQEHAARSSEVRKRLQAVGLTRRPLRERMTTVQTDQRVLDEQVARLYFMRLVDAVGGTGPVDPKSLSTSNRQRAGQCLDTLIRRRPEMKQRLKATFPGLLEHFYPAERPPKPAGDMKKGEIQKKDAAPKK